MPVYDVGYRRWEGRFRSRVLRWWPIVRRGVPLLARSRVLVAFLVLCLIFSLVAQLITIVQLMSGATLMSLWFVKAYMDWMMLFSATMLVFAGARQIADDIRANALQIYGSRPITWVDYYEGKFAVVAALLLLTTLLPGIAFYLFGMGSQAVLPPISQIGWSLLAITAYALAVTTVLSAIILALSSLGKSAWFAGVVWLCIYLLPYLLADELSRAFQSSVPYYFSLHHLLSRVGWECAGWARMTSIDWLDVPVTSLRDLARGNFFSLLGRQDTERLLGSLYDFTRLQTINDADVLKRMILDGLKELEVIPQSYEGMRLGPSLVVLAGSVSVCVATTLGRLRRAVQER